MPKSQRKFSAIALRTTRSIRAIKFGDKLQLAMEIGMLEALCAGSGLRNSEAEIILGFLPKCRWVHGMCVQGERPVIAPSERVTRTGVCPHSA